MKKRRRRLEKQKLIAEKRENRRLKRLNVLYDGGGGLPYGWTSDPVLNKRVKARKPNKGSKITLKLPERLNFRESVSETVGFLTDLREESLKGTNHEIFLDHSQLEEVSPAAAVALTAEISRCRSYSRTKKRFKGNYPRAEKVAFVLDSIGYYQYFNVPSPKVREQFENRIYVKVLTYNYVVGKEIDRLLSIFERFSVLSEIEKKRIYTALIECMENVRQHAYDQGTTKPVLFGQWWMAGFCDLETRQIAVIFYDQGEGIPRTLRQRRSVKLKNFFGQTESEMLKFAVETGISRTGSARRGNGLPSLRGVITDGFPEGHLRVVSNYGDYTYYRNQKARVEDCAKPLAGSLMLWSARLDKMPKVHNRVDDLAPVEGEQLNLTV